MCDGLDIFSSYGKITENRPGTHRQTIENRILSPPVKFRYAPGVSGFLHVHTYTIKEINSVMVI